MLHLKSLEYFALPLKHEDLDSCFIKLPAGFLGIFVLSESIKYVLGLEDTALAIDLFYEDQLVELYTHRFECSRHYELLVLALNYEADRTNAVPLFRSLEPMMHDSRQVDVICKLAFTLFELSLFLSETTESQPGIHGLLLQEVTSQ